MGTDIEATIEDGGWSGNVANKILELGWWVFGAIACGLLLFVMYRCVTRLYGPIAPSLLEVELAVTRPRLQECED